MNTVGCKLLLMLLTGSLGQNKALCLNKGRMCNTSRYVCNNNFCRCSQASSQNCRFCISSSGLFYSMGDNMLANRSFGERWVLSQVTTPVMDFF